MKLAFAFLVLGLTAHAQEAKPNLSLRTNADFVTLHVSGTAPIGATALQFRFASSGSIVPDATWSPATTTPPTDGAFTFDVPLPHSRWSELHVRALKGEEVLATKEARAKPRTFTMLTAERVAALPEPQRVAWSAYLKRSEERFEMEFDTLASECRRLGLAQATPAPGSRAEFEVTNRAKEAWFSGAEAKRIAEVVMSYQTPSGGWSKAVDYAKGPRSSGTHWTSQGGDNWHYCGTIDNRTTTEQITFLASVHAATKRTDAAAAVRRGIEYLLEAQFPNGGWPQNYPLESGYHEAITLNDNAMVHVLEVMLAIAEAKAPFGFTDTALRERARAAFKRGIECLTAMQVKVDGQLTVWCAQHDPLTLAPVAARKKEPPSLSGAESAEVLKFLMRSGPVDPMTTAAIETGLNWLSAHRITGLRKTNDENGKTDFVPDSASQEVWWARFYDVQTARPMFAGAQDGIVYSTFAEMAAKNKVAYDYYTTKPRDVIEKEEPRWRKRMLEGK